MNVSRPVLKYLASAVVVDRSGVVSVVRIRSESLFVSRWGTALRRAVFIDTFSLQQSSCRVLAEFLQSFCEISHDVLPFSIRII